MHPFTNVTLYDSSTRMRSSVYLRICLEACNNSIDMLKSLLGNPPLCFSSSLLHQPHFDSLMEQILGE